MAKNDFQYGGWNFYTLQCGTIMTLISPGDCTLRCGMWLWNHDSEFIKWQHHAMWYVALGCHWIRPGQHPAVSHVALGLWHWVRQVAAPCNVADGSEMTCHWIRPNVCHIGILHLVSTSSISPQSTSFCISLRNFIQIGPPSAEKNDDMSIFKMADLSHLGL